MCSIPGLSGDRTAWAWGNSAANSGQLSGCRGSRGRAASTKVAAACRQALCNCLGIWSAVTACTRRCTEAAPSPAGRTSEYRRKAAIASPAASSSSSSGFSTWATSGSSWSDRSGGRSSSRRGTASGAQHASSRSSPAAPGAVSCSCSNASDQVVATVPPYPETEPRASRSAPTLVEQRQVGGQAVSGGLGISGGLLQRQRQSAQLPCQGAGRPLVGIASPVH